MESSGNPRVYLAPVARYLCVFIRYSAAPSLIVQQQANQGTKVMTVSLCSMMEAGEETNAENFGSRRVFTAH